MTTRTRTPGMPRWNDPQPLVFHPDRQRAHANQCVYFGHVAAPRCTNQAEPGRDLCAAHPRRF